MRLSISVLALSASLLTGCPGNGEKLDDTGTDDTGSTVGGDEDGDGFSPSEGDCDDANAEVNPDAEEICDGKDNDCDDEIDEDGETVFHADADGDGFGDPDDTIVACEPGDGYVLNADDCDDTESSAFPGADEQCDGIDNDCDGSIDEDLVSAYYRDADGDGYGDPDFVGDECSDPGEGWVSSAGDCDDSEPLAYEGAGELCDGIDNDCNGVVDDGLATAWYPDLDGDGYGDDAGALDSCTDPGADYVTSGGDCDDDEPLAWTGADEYCDEVDNDCNGLVDDDALDAVEQNADADGDGFGSATDVVYACSALVDNTLDCDDGDAAEPQVVDASASASTADGTSTNPWTTIQEGIDGAWMCVVVQAGTYYENVDFSGNDVDVASVDGWSATIIDGDGVGSVVSFETGETSAASLHGFTLQNGGGTLDSYVEATTDSSTVYTSTYNRYYGGGILIDGATPSLSDLRITANVLPEYNYVAASSTEDEYTWSYGGGIFVNNASGLVIEGVTVDWNYADQGGGLYAGDAASLGLLQSTIGYNEATDGGGYALSSGTLDLTNVVVAGNWARSGGAAWIDSGSSAWWNVTAVGNDATTGAGVAISSSGSLALYSSAVTHGVTGEGVYGEDSSVVFAAEYSDVYGNDGGEYSGVTDPTGSTGNVSVDPMYVSWTDNDTDDDDLSLDAGSPLIDAGNPSAAYNDADGSVNDVGAYGGPEGAGW